MALRVVAATLLLAALGEAHMRFVCPRPQHPNSGLKSGPCGGHPSRFDEEYMEVTPGPMTLRLEESVFHRGAPMRVAISAEGATDKYCVLLDQIPHNDAAKVKLLQPVCPIFNYPIGGCDTSLMFVTVNIPDIKCDRCFLHLISVMTDKYNIPEQGPCVADGIKATNCSTYFTCTSIKIRPTVLGATKNLDSCQSYSSNLLGNWPYMPQNGKYAMGEYGDHGISFSPLGFLRGPEFVGSSASYMLGAEPVGTCAPKQSMCAAVSSTADWRVAVGVAVLEDRLRITAVAQGSGGAPAVRLDINGQVYDFMVDPSTGLLDQTMTVKLSPGKLSSQIQVITTNKGNSESLTCMDTHFVRLTKQGSLQTQGLVLYELSSNENQLNFRYLVRDPADSGVTVRGPARSNEVGPALAQLPGARPNMTSLYESGSAKLNTAVAVHALWRGWLYLDVAGLRAQIPPFDIDMCRGNPSGICLMAPLSVSGKQPVDMGQATVETHGMATLRLTGTQLNVTLSLASLQNQDQLWNVTLLGADGSIMTALSVQGQMQSMRDSTLQEAQASTSSISGALRAALTQGLVTVRVHSASAPRGLVEGSLLDVNVATPAPTTAAPSGFFCQLFGIGCF